MSDSFGHDGSGVSGQLLINLLPAMKTPMKRRRPLGQCLQTIGNEGSESFRVERQRKKEE
jgi:hypothetical protein